MTDTPTYRSWGAMRDRCSNPKCPDYERYGARGLTVCERWQSFETFLADMGERPRGHTIDRIDGSKGYEPGNCRWATAVEQTLNSVVPKLDRESVRAIRGDKRPLGEIADAHGVSRAAVCMAKNRKTWKHVE